MHRSKINFRRHCIESGRRWIALKVDAGNLNRHDSKAEMISPARMQELKLQGGKNCDY